MANTPRVALALMADATEQNWATYSAAMSILDRQIHIVIIDSLTTPPGSPSEGDLYVVTATATGAWTGEEDNIAYYVNAAWEFLTPYDGMIVWEDTLGYHQYWDEGATAWVKLLSGSIPLGVPSEETGTSYTLVITDAGAAVRRNNASANTTTVPPNSSVAFGIGTAINVTQMGAGLSSIAGGGGVTIRSPGALLDCRVQYSSVSLIKIATDEWILAGDLA